MKEQGDTHYVGYFGLRNRNERREMLYTTAGTQYLSKNLNNAYERGPAQTRQQKRK